VTACASTPSAPTEDSPPVVSTSAAFWLLTYASAAAPMTCVTLLSSGTALFVASLNLLPSELLPVTFETIFPNIDWFGAFSTLSIFSTNGTTLNIEKFIVDLPAGIETAVVCVNTFDAEPSVIAAPETTIAEPVTVAEVLWSTKVPARKMPDCGSTAMMSESLPVAATSVCTVLSARIRTSAFAVTDALPPMSTCVSDSTTASAIENFIGPDIASEAM